MCHGSIHGDLGSGTDIIIDFADGVGGNEMVLHSLLCLLTEGYDDPQSSSTAEFVQLRRVSSDTIVSVHVNGSVGGSSFTEVAIHSKDKTG
jgi:hypothetical protein